MLGPDAECGLVVGESVQWDRQSGRHDEQNQRYDSEPEERLRLYDVRHPRHPTYFEGTESVTRSRSVDKA